MTLQPLVISPAKKSPGSPPFLPEMVRTTSNKSEKEPSSSKKMRQSLDVFVMTPKSAKSSGAPPTPYKSEEVGSTPLSSTSTAVPRSPDDWEQQLMARESKCPATPTSTERCREPRHRRMFTAPPVMPEAVPGSSKHSAVSLQRGRSSSSLGTPSSSTRPRPDCILPALATGGFVSWKRGHRIGSGSHGCVYKAQDTMTGQIFAVKMADIEMSNAEDKQFAERLEAELGICKDLRHPHIVRYLGHEYIETKLCIKLEYVPGGSLLALLGEFGPLQGLMMQTASRGLVEGLTYLHTHDPPVVHRDIKGANVLVDTDFCVKLADFGCSKRSSDTQSFVTIGSVPWMAPEVINQNSGHGRKADIWSLGCTFIEMATAEKPWGADRFNNIMYALAHIGMSKETPPIPETLTEVGQDIIRQCVQRDPSARMGAQELLDHEFVRGVPSTRPRSTGV